MGDHGPLTFFQMGEWARESKISQFLAAVIIFVSLTLFLNGEGQLVQLAMWTPAVTV